MELIYGLVILVYALICVCAASVAAAVPVFLAVQAWRAVSGRRRRPREPLDRRRGDAEAELREQYAAGVLTLAGLEERLDETLRARSHFEVDSVLRDLPQRPPRVTRVALFEAVAGVGVLLVCHGAVAQVAGAGLALGALAPPLRWRPLVAAFAAGLALLAAPLVALPLGASAAWRFVIRD